jgi:sulfur relay (sulfurtransferase) DsrC/TusE family protein
MAIFEHGSVSIEVDEDGFMQEPEKWNEEVKEIYELFPSGPAKGACKVAGLPKPTGCV